jgi:peptidoglycan hydrolase-like protein with peptidoglycan-binding domain
MSRITFPLNPGMRGPQVGDLQAGLQLLLDRALIFPIDPSARQQLSAVLQREHSDEHYGDATQRLVHAFQEENHIPPSGSVDELTANELNHLLDELTGAAYHVKGTVRRIDGVPVGGVLVSAFDRDLRNEQALGRSQTDKQGFYQIQYTTDQFSRAERGSADLVVKTLPPTAPCWPPRISFSMPRQLPR